MIYLPVRISGPTVEPITPADLKGAGHIRIPHDAEDVLLRAYITAARQYVEWRTGRTLMLTTWEQVSDRFPSDRILRLGRGAPLVSVVWVRYTNSANVTSTWASSGYLVNLDAMPGFITPAYGETWPDFEAAETAAVRVRYTAGLDPAASPLIYPDEALLQAIRLLVAGMYENRESEIMSEARIQQTIAPQYGVEPLLWQYRVQYEF